MAQPAANRIVRYDVRFIGRVQGVYFRATTQQIARGFDVVGFVCNQDDGSVRVTVQGAFEQVERFLESVRLAKADNIVDVQVTHAHPADELSGFTIRR